MYEAAERLDAAARTPTVPVLRRTTGPPDRTRGPVPRPAPGALRRAHGTGDLTAALAQAAASFLAGPDRARLRARPAPPAGTSGRRDGGPAGSG
ncbi:hypothetical protein ACFUCQ_18475 [Streptomyces sp. NPDC057197]|uniref:hypothetical protein n=1 Tax=Streptomyces sp. NPDC057197 TaxID=3346045 RepID=UPI003645CFCB